MKTYTATRSTYSFAFAGLFYFRKQQKEHCGVTGSLPNLHHLTQCSS